MCTAILASFQPAPSHEPQVERLLRGMVAPSRAEPGCRRYDLYRARGEDAGFRIFEVYDDDTAVEAHRASPHYKAYRAEIGAHLAAPIGVTLLDPQDVLD